MIRTIAKVLKVLNSETDPSQISLGLCFAVIVAFTPVMSLHNLVILFIVFFFRINLSAFFLGILLFSGIAYFLDPLFHTVGMAVLTVNGLEKIWTAFYNITIWRIEYFNNTIVMGSLVCSFVLFVPLLFLFNGAVRLYRKHVYARVQKLKIVQAIKANKLYRTYVSLKEWGGTS